jgi:hypothetical protein
MEEIAMNKLKLLSVAAILAATVSSPVFAQEGVIGPGSRYGLQPQPGPTDQGDQWNGFAPFGAGAATSAPFRAMNGNGSYDMMPDDSYCAQRYRSYDPRSGTFMGYDGRRHPCQ